MDLSFIYIVCLFVIPPQICCHSAPSMPIVGVELSDAGMHRDLQYTVQFDYPLAGKECEYMLEQPLPAAVYVSFDQLEDLKRLKKLNAIYPRFVDIEVPSEKGQDFSVLLKGTPKTTDSFKLPVHFRYHAPSSTSTFVVVDIPKPKMYMKCPAHDSDLLEVELQTLPNINYCRDEHNFNFILQYSKNNDNLVDPDMKDCGWKFIHVDYQLKSELNAKIPVGNAKAFPPILYVTIIVSWIVSLWTVYKTHAIPRRINHKLEEQRILQSKIK